MRYQDEPIDVGVYHYGEHAVKDFLLGTAELELIVDIAQVSLRLLKSILHWVLDVITLRHEPLLCEN